MKGVRWLQMTSFPKFTISIADMAEWLLEKSLGPISLGKSLKNITLRRTRTEAECREGISEQRR